MQSERFFFLSLHHAPTHIQYKNSTYLHSRNLVHQSIVQQKINVIFSLIFPYCTSKYKKIATSNFFLIHQQLFFSSFSHQQKKKSFEEKIFISPSFYATCRHLFLPLPSNVTVPIPCLHQVLLFQSELIKSTKTTYNANVRIESSHLNYCPSFVLTINAMLPVFLWQQTIILV